MLRLQTRCTRISHLLLMATTRLANVYYLFRYLFVGMEPRARPR